MDELEYERYIARVFGVAEMPTNGRSRFSDEVVEDDVCGLGSEMDWTQDAQ